MAGPRDAGYQDRGGGGEGDAKDVQPLGRTVPMSEMVG